MKERTQFIVDKDKCIPEDHYMRLIVGFGYPEIPYARGVQKDRSAKIHRYTKERET